MGRFTTSDGIELRYEVRGEGPVVMVCHGGPNNVCDTLVEDLAPLASTCTLVFTDYRGSGQSAVAPADTYRFTRLADDLDELRAHLGHESVAVLAHSMGGFVALQYVLRHPERCDRLALAGTTPCVTADAMLWPTIRALGPLRTLELVAKIARYVVLWSWRSDSPARDRAQAAPMRVTQRPSRANRERASVALARQPVPNDNADALMADVRGFDLRDRLGEIACPVLVLCGTRDAVMAAGAGHVAAGIPHASVRMLADIGHEPFLEDPDPTFRELTTFLTSSDLDP